jgi:hypothetical protein
MEDEDQSRISRRTVGAALGLGGITVGTMVATGGAAWAAPLIKAAIGVPAAVSSVPSSDYIFERGEAIAKNQDNHIGHVANAGQFVVYVTALNGAVPLTAANTTAVVSVDTGDGVISFYHATTVGTMTKTALGAIKQITPTKSAIVVGAGNEAYDTTGTGLFHVNVAIDPDDSTVGEPGEATVVSPTYTYEYIAMKVFTPPTIVFSTETTNPPRPDAAYTLDAPAQVTVVNSTQTSVYFEDMVEQVTCTFPGNKSLSFAVVRSIPGVPHPTSDTKIAIGASYLLTLTTNRLPTGFLSGLSHGDSLIGAFRVTARYGDDTFALTGSNSKAATFTYV